MNLHSARQSKIDLNKRWPCTPCKASEEDRFCEAAASLNSQSITERGINISELPLNHLSNLCEKLDQAPTQYQLFVNINQQRLHLVKSREWIKSYVVSTAFNGVGQEDGSGKTPLGLHVIASKVGEGAAPYAVFKARELTGEIAQPNSSERSITSRILWLRGLEPQFNQGSRNGIIVDTYKRYVYIHGTNDLEHLGQPVSKGCVCLSPEDTIDLFNQVSEGTQVYIYT